MTSLYRFAAWGQAGSAHGVENIQWEIKGDISAQEAASVADAERIAREMLDEHFDLSDRWLDGIDLFPVGGGL